MELDNRFEDSIKRFKELYKAYQDKYIFDDEYVLEKWIGSMRELIVEITNLQSLVAIEVYDNIVETALDELTEGQKETVNRIEELGKELNN